MPEPCRVSTSSIGESLPNDNAKGVILDHIVIVVEDLSDAIEKLSVFLGRPVVIEGNSELGYRRAIFALGGADQRIEVCQPLGVGDIGGDSQASQAFRRRLERFGSGIHSLAFKVTNLDVVRRSAEVASVSIIESQHSDSFFVHPDASCGALLQFLQVADVN